MQRPIPSDTNGSEFYIGGDVTIEADATIGPGVVLQAAPGARLLVRTGVCLGAGAVLQACGGSLEIESDATIGARVLIVGAGTVGAAASIGGESTLLDPNIAPKQSVASGTLLGTLAVGSSAATGGSPDPSTNNSANGSTHAPDDFWADAKSAFVEAEVPTRSPDARSRQEEPAASSNPKENTNGNASTFKKDTEISHPEEGEPTVTVRREEVVVGRQYVRQLLTTLFPHKDL